MSRKGHTFINNMETATEFSKEIYKKDSSGKIRVLHVYTEGADLIQESGVLDGALVEHRNTCVGKNIGRSNETTPEQQAQAEAKSKIDTKMTTGYFNTIEDAEEKGGAATMLPMLAKPYDTVAKKIDWTKAVFLQPKLDGMRCLAIVKDGAVNLISRKGKPIETVNHIIATIEKIGLENAVLDGELYAHGKTFQENMRIIKKYREGETEAVCFNIYDVIEDKPYEARYRAISLFCQVANTPTLSLVDCYKITAEDQISEWHGKFLEDGYEGSIIRHGLDGYAVNKRASQLLKYKDFIDIACEVIDVVPSDKNPEQGVVHCKNDVGTFGCGMKFSHAEREDILTNKSDYIGQTAEIRFFEYTDDGLPRFPVCVGFRLDK